MIRWAVVFLLVMGCSSSAPECDVDMSVDGDACWAAQGGGAGCSMAPGGRR